MKENEKKVAIRPDLWQAFTSLNPRFPVRVYDRQLDRANRLQKDPPTEQFGERLIPIKPIQESQQKEWARNFARQLTDKSIASDLLETLNEERWFRSFQRTLAKDADTEARWALFKSEKVKEAIEEWLTDNSLEIDLRARKHRTTPSADAAADAIRRRLIRAIHRMPLHELASLRLPVGYLLD